MTRYFVVGVASYLIDVGLLALGWHVLQLPLWAATSLGFWSSFSVNFLLSRHWTFEAGHMPSATQLVRYGVLVCLNYGVTVALVTALHRAGLEVVVARTLVIAMLTVSTYVAYRRWVFVDRSEPVGG